MSSKRNLWVPDQFRPSWDFPEENIDEITPEQLSAEVERQQVYEKLIFDESKLFLDTANNLASFYKEQNELENSVFNKIPFEAFIAALLGTNFIRENVSGNTARALFLTSAALAGYKTYNYASLGIRPIVDTKDGFTGTTSKFTNFFDKINRNSNPVEVATFLAGSMAAIMFLPSSTSILAFGISSVPASSLAYNKLGKLEDFIGKDVGKIGHFFEDRVEKVENIPTDIGSWFKSLIPFL